MKGWNTERKLKQSRRWTFSRCCAPLGVTSVGNNEAVQVTWNFRRIGKMSMKSEIHKMLWRSEQTYWVYWWRHRHIEANNIYPERTMQLRHSGNILEKFCTWAMTQNHPANIFCSGDIMNTRGFGLGFNFPSNLWLTLQIFLPEACTHILVLVAYWPQMLWQACRLNTFTVVSIKVVGRLLLPEEGFEILNFHKWIFQLPSMHRKLTSWSAAPSSDCYHRIGTGVGRGKTYGTDVWVSCEVHRSLQLQEGDVICNGLGIITGMHDGSCCNLYGLTSRPLKQICGSQGHVKCPS